MEKLLDFEKLKYCFECGICTASCPVTELLPEHYNPRVLLHSLPLAETELLDSADLWLCAWCYRCHKRCPQGLKVPEIFLALRRFAVKNGYLNGFSKSLKIIREKIPLPASCCHICFHPERAIKDEERVLDNIQHFILDYKGEQKKEEVYGERVAIIGSGPAGLSAAQDLAQKGFSVTVFEASSSPGGMLRRCIPRDRLPREIVDADVKRITDLGVTIKTEEGIHDKLQLERLLRDYSAVLLATGADKEVTLGIEGEELEGVFPALEFLERTGEGVRMSGRVAIIGGGNVALDCARTALSRGAEEATVLYRRSRKEMPATPWEVKEAEEEGVEIEFLVAPKRIQGEDGGVKGIECVKMELGDRDRTGRRRPISLPDSEFLVNSDTVIVAIGQVPDTNFLPETVETTEKGTIIVNPFTLETSLPGLFAGGDVVTGSATVMDAIIAGRRAAIAIDRYVRDLPLEPFNLFENMVRA